MLAHTLTSLIHIQVPFTMLSKEMVLLRSLGWLPGILLSRQKAEISSQYHRFPSAGTSALDRFPALAH